jgi:hypothetical protein
MDEVTCDTCPNTSEAGWGDTPHCFECHENGRATEGHICQTHLVTTYDDDKCMIGEALPDPERCVIA